MATTNNPLLCDPETGFCELPISEEMSSTKPNSAEEKSLKIIYFTDPICSSCWGIEPQLRKLKLEYGRNFDIEYYMGGLLPDWSYNSGGISKPSDVAHHWDEVSLHYDMPIDGDIWLEDPLPSSYPPSIAFKAAQLQSHEKAIMFLRRIREMVFLEKKNITQWQHLEKAAHEVGLDANQLKTDDENKAQKLFEADLQYARSLGVRGFPTIFIINSQQEQRVIYGVRPYSTFVEALQQLSVGLVKNPIPNSIEELFDIFPTLTAKEFSVITDTPRDTAEQMLDKATEDNFLTKLTTKNGALWKRLDLGY